jgi:hypothetical protein
MDFISQLSVSPCGKCIWGVHITEYPKSRLLMQCFQTRKSLLYNYEHQDIVLAVMIAEDLGLAMTGGRDNKAVLHCLQSGKTIKVLDFGVECLFRLGSVVALAVYDKEQIRFFDLVEQKMLNISPIETGLIIFFMQMRIGKFLKNNSNPQLSLLVEGTNSILMEIILPELITQKSNTHIKCIIR